MKNIKNSKIIKTLLFMVATVAMFVILMSSINLGRLHGSSYNGYENGAKVISSYDNTFGTDYYRDFINTQTALTYSVDTFAEVETIIYDNMEHSVHELLGIKLDDSIDNGIRYLLYLNDEIIGTDGITDQNSYYNSYNSTIQHDYFYVWEEGSRLTVPVNDPFFKELDRYRTEDGNYSMELELKVFYEGEVAERINGYVGGINIDMQSNFAFLGSSTFVFLLICLFFAFNAGKKNDEDGIYFNSLDKVFIDYKLIIIATALTLFVFGYYLVTDVLGVENVLWYCVVMSPILTFMLIDFCSNVGKKIRVHKFWESISIIAFCKFIYHKQLKPFSKFLGTKSSFPFILFAVIVIFISFIGLFLNDAFIAYILLLPFTILAIINPVRIAIALENVKNGKGYKAKNNVLDFPFNSAFADIEDITKNMVKVYKEGETAQKVKTELISNVSHDLRTPLTAIIGYVDLLEKNSENYDEETNEYIRVLKEKSDRMNTMVEDLFDLAKSANNDVQMNFEKLNVKKLVEQSLSELDDVVSEEKLILRLDESLHISADGNKMYRVMQNLIENAVKYSFEGTRIYIDCYASDNIVLVEFKNIANYQMDFTPDEIIQRFNRGDKSRTTRGSGLGLSIAKTYTNLNNGDFKVDVDGDMFKVTLIFDKVEF